jgi:septum formation protein
VRHKGADDIILENLRQNNVMDEMRAQPRRLVLASTSPYRKALLERFGLDFEVAAPHVDERPLPGEAPRHTALRLSGLKAQAVRAAHRDALIVGSDQVAISEGRLLGKPGDHASAVRQLRALSGKTAEFHTAVTLLDAANSQTQSSIVPCRVQFRALDDRRIERYLRREQPYDCAGSAKIEGLGIALVARMDTDDPTSLIGLPLIALSEMLERAGLPVI